MSTSSHPSGERVHCGKTRADGGEKLLATGQLAYLYQQLDVEQRVRDGRDARRKQQHCGIRVDGTRCHVMLGTGNRLGPAVQGLHLRLLSSRDAAAGHRRASASSCDDAQNSFHLGTFQNKVLLPHGCAVYWVKYGKRVAETTFILFYFYRVRTLFSKQQGHMTRWTTTHGRSWHKEFKQTLFVEHGNKKRKHKNKRWDTFILAYVQRTHQLQ